MKNLVLKMVILCLIINVGHTGYAQFYQETKSEWNWKERTHFGGDLGLSFGTITQINVAPAVSVDVSTKFSAGLKGVYIFYKNNDFDYQTTVYGAGLFGQYQIYKSIFLHTEIEELNLDNYEEYYDTNTNSYVYKKNGRTWITSVFVGGGIKYPIGERSFISMMLLWNLNESLNSPYTNPVFRISIFI